MVQCGVCGMVFNAYQNTIEADGGSQSDLPYSPATQPIDTIAELPAPQLPDEDASVIVDISESESTQMQPAESLFNVDMPMDVQINSAENVGEDDRAQANPIQFGSKSPRKHILAWSFFSLLLICLLILQFSIFYRVKLAATVPQLEPVLHEFCKLTGCSIDLPKDVNLVKITDTAFEVDPKNPDFISVRIGLENESDMRIGLPNVALSLTNDQDEVIAKRNFTPSQFLVPPVNEKSGIPAHEAVSAHLLLDVHGISVSGYKVLLFY
jgi:hypothetical protein